MEYVEEVVVGVVVVVGAVFVGVVVDVAAFKVTGAIC